MLAVGLPCAEPRYCSQPAGWWEGDTICWFLIYSTADKPVLVSNLVANIPGSGSAVVTVIAGHYDTKRMGFPSAGTNDGGPAWLTI